MALARRVTVAAVCGCALLGGTTTASPPVPVAGPVPAAGLAQAGWRVEEPAEQRRELGVLRERERRAAAPLVALGPLRPAPAPAVPVAAVPVAAVPAAPTAPALPVAAPGGDGTIVVGPEAVAVALAFALAQIGKPYVWGAEGPDSYDCSGLTQRSYAEAGVGLPRTSREQARVGLPVRVADLLPGDLVFWAYDPADLGTVHHVAMYAGNGMVVQAPQPGEFVEVTPLWLDGYAGAVRIAGGPAVMALPSVPGPGVDTGVDPSAPGADAAGFPGFPGSTAAGTWPAGPTTTAPPATTLPAPTTPAPSGTVTQGPAASPTPSPTATGTPVPTRPPGTSSPGTATPPATTAPASPTTAPATTAPATTSSEPTTPESTTPAGTSSAASPSP